MSYSRPQLKLLLLLAVTLCAGLGVREWRAGFPDLAERLEHFDRDPGVAAAGPEATARTSAPTPSERTSAADGGAATVEAASVAGRGAAEPAGGMSPRADAVAARASPPAPVVDARPVDINRAGLGEIARLPGIGPSMAARIVAERDRRGRFDSPDALRSVIGMGPKKLAAIRDLITVSE